MSRLGICLLVAGMVAAPALAAADPNMLRVDALAITPLGISTGTVVTITARFKNIASETAASDVDWVIQVGATTLRSGVRPQLAAGASFTETATWTAVAGPHTVRAFVGYDPQEVDAEGRHDNARTNTLNGMRSTSEIVPIDKRLAPGPAPVRVPYRMELQVSPESGATQQTAITLSLREGGSPPTMRQCTFDAIPAGGGASWSANGGASCRATTQLAPGVYRLRANVATADSPTDAPTSSFSQIDNYVVRAPGPMPPGRGMPGGGTPGGGRGGPAPLATPVIVLASLIYDGPKFHIEYTVCNVVTDAIYSPLISPSGPLAGTRGDPPEDFLPEAFSNNGASMDPPCPGGLPNAAGLRPAAVPVGPDAVVGVRPACGNPVTYTLTVQAARGAELKSASATFSVKPVIDKPCPK